MLVVGDSQRSFQRHSRTMVGDSQRSFQRHSRTTVGEPVEPWLVSLSNHGCMVEQTLKQVQGDSKLLFDILKFFCFYCHTRIQILNRNLKVIFVDNLARHFAAF